MDARMLVQSLKGSKAQIMMAFLFAGHAMDVSELIGWTGLKRQTIQESIRPLEALGLLGSQKLEHGREVFVLGGEMLPLLSSVFQLGDGASLLEPGQMSVLGTSRPTTTTNRRMVDDKSRVVVVPPADVRKTDIWKANHKACRECGIGEPKASTISELEHVTPEFIRSHIENAGAGHIGLAILRIEGNEPVPEIEEHYTSRYTSSAFFDELELMKHQTTKTCGKPYSIGTRNYRCTNYVEPGHEYCSDHEEDK